VVVAVVYAVLFLWYAALYDYDALDFVHVGTIFSEKDPDGGWGYDGQFYYYVARDPSTAASFLDNPSYRLRRIAYPLVARALALGNEAAVPLAMLVVNVVAVAGGTELLARVLASRGLSPWYSLGFGVSFGQLASVTHQLGDPFGSAFLALGIWAFARGRFTAMAAAFGVAALSRDSLALVPIGFVIGFVLTRRWRAALLTILLGLAPLGIWTLLLEVAYRDAYDVGVNWAPIAEPLPLAGTIRMLRATPSFAITVVVFLAPCWLLVALALRDLWRGGLRPWRNRRLVEASPVLWASLATGALLVFLAAEQVIDFLVPARLTIGAGTAVVAYAALTRSAGARALSAYFAAAGVLYPLMVAVGATSVIP
jgi:hypothetical protein